MRAAAGNGVGHGGADDRGGAAGGSEDPRLAAVRRLLAAEGLSLPVSVAGRDGDIAAIRAEPGLRARLAGLAPEIRAIGFRYVALEPRGSTEDIEDS